MRGRVGIFIFVAAMLFVSIGHGQVSTNDPVVPLIQMSNVPISTAIENLARQAGINFLIDPRLTQKWSDSEEPAVTFRLENAIAGEVLKRMLALRSMGLLEDPVSNIAFIVPTGQVTNNSFPVTPARSDDANIIPLVQMSHVPITTAIASLAKQADFNYIIDPKLCQLWMGSSEPELNIRMEKVTAWNLANRLLNIRNLILKPDRVTHVARIAFSDQPLPVVDTSPLDPRTNDAIIPLIVFTSVPLDTALENLIQQSKLNIVLDPQLTHYSDAQNQPPNLTVRWTNLTAKQAIAALCENYDLIIVENHTTDVIRIQPKR